MRSLVKLSNLHRRALAHRAEIEASLALVANSGLYVGGPPVEAFESAFARSTGYRHCVGVGNGLDALEIGLRSLGIGPGDRVIVPAFTFLATWLAIDRCGATPVGIDVHADTGILNSSLVGGAVDERVKAILPVHLYGNVADIDALSAISGPSGIKIIDDCAQVHGHDIFHDKSHSVVDASAFSFYPTKNLGALGDAGSVLFRDEAAAERARQIRSYGSGSTKYDYLAMGMNSRLDPLQAACLSTFLGHLPNWNETRQRIASVYLEAIAPDFSTAVLGPLHGQTSKAVWHHFVVLATNRARLQSRLLELGIESDCHYPYVAEDVWRRLKGLQSDCSRHPVSHFLAEHVVSLPIDPWLTESEIERVCIALGHVSRENLLQAGPASV